MSSLLTLDGCRPTPLFGYLKALGILRLVTEQSDQNARGFWLDERFQLKTTLNHDSLLRFFLEHYQPTPIIAPWNGRAGFLEGDNETTEESGADISNEGDEDQQGSQREGAKLRQSYERTTAQRFQRLRSAAETFASLPTMTKMDQARTRWKTLEHQIKKRKPTASEKAEIARLKKIEKTAKAELVAELRSWATQEQSAWLDACIQLAQTRTNSPLLLGGGSDGSREYGVAFGRALHQLFSFQDGSPKEGKKAPWIASALFGCTALLEECDSFGHFNPGQSGYNGTTGYEGSRPLNPWDMILALEGALVWSGGVTRRLDNARARSAASFPFSFEATRSGSGQLSISDQNRTPGELWCPVWSRPTGLAELRCLFREGRITLGSRAARNGLDAALGIAALGKNSGITSFIRIALYQSDAKMPHTSAPLHRHHVGSTPATSSPTLELVNHPWIDRLRSLAANKEAPAVLRNALRSLEDALFNMVAQPQNPLAVQGVLITLGQVGLLTADRPKLQSLSPPPYLSHRWMTAADDGSHKFRIAAALAGLRAKLPQQESASRTRYGLYMRQHLAPLDPIDHQTWSAAKGKTLSVWGSGTLIDNLTAIAQRRFIAASQLDLRDKPFSCSFGVYADDPKPVAVGSDEIATFLHASERFDRHIADVLVGLAWVEPAAWPTNRNMTPLPLVYAALKPLFIPHTDLERIRPQYAQQLLPLPPSLPTLLMSGRVRDAYRLGQERARASGLPTPFMPARLHTRIPTPSDIRYGRRLLAALIIPVTDGVLDTCINQAYPSDEGDDS